MSVPRYKTHDKPTQEMINECNVYAQMENISSCANRLIGKLLSPARKRSHSANKNTMTLIRAEINGEHYNPFFMAHVESSNGQTNNP